MFEHGIPIWLVAWGVFGAMRFVGGFTRARSRRESRSHHDDERWRRHHRRKRERRSTAPGRLSLSPPSGGELSQAAATGAVSRAPNPSP